MGLRIEKHYSLEHAERVLKLIRVLWKKRPEATRRKWDVTVHAWSNGREQGFHLDSHERAPEVPGEGLMLGVALAQQRNSDQVIVIAGDAFHFDVTTNMPHESLWDEGTYYFNHDEDAAAKIVGFLTGEKVLQRRSKEMQKIEDAERMGLVLAEIGGPSAKDIVNRAANELARLKLAQQAKEKAGK